MHRIGCESVDTPVVPMGVISKVEQRRPRIVCVQFVCAANISASVCKALQCKISRFSCYADKTIHNAACLFFRIENYPGYEASTATDLDIFPGVGLSGDCVGQRSNSGSSKRRKNFELQHGSESDLAMILRAIRCQFIGSGRAFRPGGEHRRACRCSSLKGTTEIYAAARHSLPRK